MGFPFAPIYVTVSMILAGMSIGTILYMTKHPNEFQAILDEIKLRWMIVQGKIQIKVNETNDIVVQEVDKSGRVIRQFVHNAEKEKNKLFKQDSTPIDNGECVGLMHNDIEYEECNDKCKSPTPKQSTPWRSVAESFADGYDTEMGSTFTPSITSDDNEYNDDTCSAKNITQSKNRYSCKENKCPPVPPKVSTGQTSSFQRHANHTPSSNDDDDLYHKPLARTIIENIPLEVLEQEINRRQKVSASFSSSYSCASFKDAQEYPQEEANKNEDSTPPVLPPRLPIDNPSKYVPEFSRHSSLHSAAVGDSLNAKLCQTQRRYSIQSNVSSILSSSTASSEPLNSGSTSWHFVPHNSSSQPFEGAATDYERYLSQTYDDAARSSFHHHNPRQNPSFPPLSRTSTLSSVAQSCLSSEPSLVWSPNPSFVRESCLDPSNTGNSQSQRGPVPASSSNRNATISQLSRQISVFDESETDEAVTPVLTPVSTLDCESIIYQDSSTTDEDGSSSAASRHGPRRHFH